MIDRRIADYVIKTSKQYPVTILVGPRQIGKSYLLYNFLRPAGYSYVSFDYVDALVSAKAAPRAYLESHPFPLIIDEADRCPEIFPEIERIVNEERLKPGNEAIGGLYILTGSSKLSLLAKSHESLAGRAAIIEMNPLSIAEIKGEKRNPFSIEYSAYAGKAYEGDWKEYCLKGFLPRLYAGEEMDLTTFYSSYVTTYLDKDVGEALKEMNLRGFMDFLRLLAADVSQEYVMAKYARLLGKSEPTIKAWSEMLEKSGIIHFLRPYIPHSPSKALTKRPKIYFFDTGLVCHLLGLTNTDMIENSVLKGPLFENMAFNEIRKSYSSVGPIPRMSYYRDSSQREIDFLIEIGGEVHPIEVKATMDPEPHMGKNFHILKDLPFASEKGAVVYAGPRAMALSDSLTAIPFMAI